LGQPGFLVDDWGNPVRPAHLSLAAGAPGGVKLGHDGARLFQTIVTGIGGTPMPPFDGLKGDEVWDLVHYVQSLRAMAHEAELVAVGLKEEDRVSARKRIWASMSNYADVKKTGTVGFPRQTAASAMSLHEPAREP
jgi:hypothetical protein